MFSQGGYLKKNSHLNKDKKKMKEKYLLGWQTIAGTAAEKKKKKN